MAISRLQASLASATNELTIAAAAINLDFTLFKIDAPKEFHTLGQHLSKNRKHDAEVGTTHVTARRLGALFENICPATPKLVKAYGTRVSEISAAASIKSSTESTNGIFASYSGVDGTSIWAAATSSSTALQLQLLACMLARVWTGPEATSVWVEMIKERKAEIATLFEEEESVHFSTLKAATQLEMPRSQLADWDASARSWLRTADKIKSLEQKQLMLIIDNINLSVNDDMKVYSSVITAWKSALESLENLISGQPQAISNGSTLLALYSWHLYPDIIVQGASSTEVLMRDPLVAPGGVLTLGLQRRSTDDINRGVYWSLSLAHLRHYGRPVRSEGSLCNDSSRVTFTQFRQAVFGAFLSGWNVSGTGIALAARFFVKAEALFERCARPPVSSSESSSSTRAAHNVNYQGSSISSEDEDQVMEDFNGEDSENPPYTSAVHPEQNNITAHMSHLLVYSQDSEHWFHHLAQAAQEYLELDDVQGNISKLVRLGLRRPQFFGDEKHNDQNYFFGLSRAPILLSCLAGSEERIAYLRKVARDMNHAPPDMIIRYSVNNGPAQYATAVPRQEIPIRRTGLTENNRRDLKHHRWLKYDIATPAQAIYFLGEVSKLQQTNEFIPSHLGNQAFEVMTAPGVWKEYSFFFGDMDSAALFSPTISDTSSGNFVVQQEPPIISNDGLRMEVPKEFYALSRVPYAPTIEDLLWCLDSNLFAADRLVQRLNYMLNPLGGVTRTLNAFSVISKVYKLLPDASIDLRALDRPLTKAYWVSSMYSAAAGLGGRSELGTDDKNFKFDINLLTRGTAIACIAYLESGNCDIRPSDLSDVFALSTGDSIYVAMPLLCDPYQTPQEYEVKRILGNVGRAGITMLIPPENPMLRECKPDAWKVISNTIFNGSAEDHFNRTSLHLSFTEFSQPIQTRTKGLQDNQVSFLESVVSVYDSGVWVGDIDVLNAVRSPAVRRIPPANTCIHAKDQRPGRELISVENWDEVLDKPHHPFVVRANGNWLGRLAVTSVIVQKYSDPDVPWKKFESDHVTSISICPPSVCWACLHPDVQDRFHSLKTLPHLCPIYIY